MVATEGGAQNSITDSILLKATKDDLEKYYNEEQNRPEKYISYITRYLRFLDRKQSCDKKGENDIPRAVKQKIKQLIESIQADHESQFLGKSSGIDKVFYFDEYEMCGSYAEKVKVSHFDEFDYVIPITVVSGDNKINRQEITFEEVELPQTKPSESECTQKGFFKIFMEESLMTTLGLGNCGGIEKHGKRELLAAKVQKAYTGKVGRSKEMAGTLVKASGPAVTVYFKAEEKGFPISIDLTFAIKKMEPFPPGVELKGGLGKVEYCYFVPAHDFWRMSFSNKETEYIRDLEEEEKRCLRSLKVCMFKRCELYV